MAKKDEAPDKGEAKKKGGLLKWIILGVLLVVLGAGGFFAYQFFLAPKSENATEADAGKKGSQADQGPAGETSMVSLPPFVVNLADPLGRRYLKIALDMEVTGVETAALVNKEMPKIKDKLLLLLSSKSYADLAPMSAKLELKTEIVSRVNQVLGQDLVKQVLFTEFIIQ